MTTDIYYSTYARAILSELRALAKLIRKYSLASKKAGMSDSAIEGLLSIREIQEALFNPQNALKPNMSAYAAVIKAHRDVVNAQDQAALQRSMTQEAIRKMRDKLAAATMDLQKQEITAALHKLEASFKAIVTAQQQLGDIEKQMDAFEKKVADLAAKHDKEWETYRAHYLKNLVDELRDADIDLTDMEKKELQTQEAWPEILERFQVLNLAVPDFLHVDAPNFTTYFHLKAYLAVHASLNRRMLPATPVDIAKILKNLLK